MLTGYNTDVGHLGLVFHVQTEDKGLASASIESLVYVGGQILGKRQTGYRDMIAEDNSSEAIVDLMDRQHRLMIAEIKNGHYDSQLAEQGLISAEQAAASTAADASAPIPISEEDSGMTLVRERQGGAGEPGSPETLDEIILEYLNSEEEREHLVLMMEVDREFALGEPASLEFRTKGSISGEPVSGTRIVVKMISTVAEPRTLVTGETDVTGKAVLNLEVPNLQRGSSALIVTATSDIGTAEIKHLL